METKAKFDSKLRYLKKVDDGYIYPYTHTLAKRSDMREFIPDFSDEEEMPDPNADVVAQGLVTEEMLNDKTKEQLCDYAMAVYDTKLDKREPRTVLIEQILELQKMAV